jgi:hypothetical protein
MAMNHFVVMKSMLDDDVVSFVPKIKEWLSTRLGSELSTSTYTTVGSITIADKWSLEVMPIFGKFNTWSMTYQICINDDIVAVEFALVKDTL